MANILKEQQDIINAEQKAKKSAVLMLSRDEAKIGQFFAAVATQYFLHRDMLTNKLVAPNFLNSYDNYEMCAGQRIMIKDLIASESFKKVMDEMNALYMEYCNETGRRTPPASIFLSRINKAFLIRQIFEHTENLEGKSQFVRDYINKESIDIDDLGGKMWATPVEHQIIILARVFDTLNDGIEEKKKTIMNSYRENLHRLTVDVRQHPNKHVNIHGGNLEAFRKGLHEYDVEQAQKQEEAAKKQ